MIIVMLANILQISLTSGKQCKNDYREIIEWANCDSQTHKNSKADHSPPIVSSIELAIFWISLTFVNSIALRFFGIFFLEPPDLLETIQNWNGSQLQTICWWFCYQRDWSRVWNSWYFWFLIKLSHLQFHEFDDFNQGLTNRLLNK